ncbi:hypothetical protein EYC98_07795 [Halieaceae bacterium IMCC14734]|uniref:Uncharacterized protein n=1 Tax=Candidatus Litorirhabdus singularis TaxID=2518993 RepID=A0ABT3TFI6_9GAMM|nr:hypothetical protein [Candidatus Litorirhabdus singularis]MCX2980779.1 hypothetical protein [Candidatus Litorirhabdus singularis]
MRLLLGRIPALLVCLFALQQASAAASDLSPYIQKLEDAAEVCDNSMFSTSDCTKICTASAEQFKQAKTFAGISGDTKNAIMNCVTAMAANEDGRSSELFNQVGALQATLSSELFKLKMAGYGQQALANAKAPPAQPVAQKVIIDTNIYDANGQVDADKIPGLYADLAQNCQGQSSAQMTKLCTSMCQNKKTEVVKLLDAIKQAPKNISAANKERNTYNLLRTIEIDLNTSCGSLYKKLPEAQQPESYLALLEFVGLIKTGVWPPKPALSLDLAIEEPDPAVKQAAQIADLTGANALNSFSFATAVSSIKSMPDYKTLETAARTIPYSAAQLRTAFNDLLSKEASYANQRQQWQEKVTQVGLAGRQKDLYEAVNGSCDMAYLRTHNQPTDWQVKMVATRADMYGNVQKAPFEQMLSPVHLHRFCYQELASRLQPQYAQIGSQSDLQTFADSYISQAPVDVDRAVARGSEPERVMSEEQWLPAWHAYAQARRAEFNSRQGNDKDIQLYAQLLKNENFEAWLNANQQETRDALKFFQVAAQSARYQLQLASADKYRLLESSFQGVDYLYGQYSRISSSTRPGSNKQQITTQIKILDMVQCEQAPALWQQFSQNPLAAGHKTLNNTGLALQACYRKVWKAGRIFDFEDFETAKTMGGQVEQQVRERGELQLNTYAPIDREQLKLTGFSYAELYAADLMVRQVERLKARFRDTLNGDVNAGAEDFTLLAANEYQLITGITIDEKDKAKGILAKRNQELKQQELLNRINGSEQAETISTQAAVSGSAMKMQYYGNCLNGDATSSYYNCECLADAYVKRKSDDPKLTDYAFAQSPAYSQCFDAQATEKTETQACKSLNLNIFDCNCFGKTFVSMLQKSGVQGLGSRQKNIDIKAKAYAACNVAF